jgi:hypothetical protein
MTLDELILQLQAIQEDIDPDNEGIEIKCAYQQNYPLRATLKNVTVLPADEDYANEDEEDSDDYTDSDDIEAEEASEGKKVVWLALGEYYGNESPYAPSAAWGEYDY